jgi:hypothetical protein
MVMAIFLICSISCPVVSFDARGSSAAHTARACSGDSSMVHSENTRARGSSSAPASIAACTCGNRVTRS